MIVALLAGYFAGALPTADLVARARGKNLRTEGSGNPGAANALGVGGRGMAITVLVLDLIKGASAALIGMGIDGDRTAITAAVAAVLGQVHNPWFGFRGGKGLGVTAGTALVIWPVGLLIALPVVAGASRVLRAAGGALAGLFCFLGAAALWASNDWSTHWGVAPDDGLVWYAIGIVAVTAPKFINDFGSRITPAAKT